MKASQQVASEERELAHVYQGYASGSRYLKCLNGTQGGVRGCKGTREESQPTSVRVAFGINGAQGDARGSKRTQEENKPTKVLVLEAKLREWMHGDTRRESTDLESCAFGSKGA